MTVHAGHKAARLRRATNSSSTGIITSVPPSTSSSSSSLPPPATSRPSLTEDLLCPSPLRIAEEGDYILVEQQSTPTQASPTLVKKARNRYGTKRKGGRRNTSSNMTGASAQDFVFSGFDPTPIATSAMENVDWQQGRGDADVSISTTISDIVSPSPSLIFVAQPSPKSGPKQKSKSSGTSNVKEKDSTLTSSPKASASKQQDGEAKASSSKASPGRYTSWFSFSNSKGEAKDGVKASETGINRDEDGKGKESTTEDTSKSRATKKKKRKAKSKVKVAPSLMTEEKKETPSPRAKKASRSVKPSDKQSDDIVSGDDCSKHSAQRSRSKACGNTPTLPEVELVCPSAHDVADYQSKARPPQRSEGDEASARACEEDKGNLPTARNRCRKLTLEALNSIVPQNNTIHERRGSTETAYHTALPTTPSWDSECNPTKLLDISSTPSSRTTTPLYSSTFPADMTPHFDNRTFSSNNSLVSMTEDSAITTEETQTSTHSSPKMDIFDDHMVDDVEGSPDKTLTVIGRGELRHYSSNLSVSQQSREIALHPLQLDTDSSSSGMVKGKESGMAQLERLQRTLHWRLISANREAPAMGTSTPIDKGDTDRNPAMGVEGHSRASISHIPFLKGPEEVPGGNVAIAPAFQNTSHSWVHLLPSLEEIHPRRSIEREMNLRSLAWLSLEEYVARRAKGLGSSDNGASVVWITHTSYPRSSVLHRTKAVHIEPLLCSSAFWLRLANKSGMGKRDSSTGSMVDSIRAYQAYLHDTSARQSPVHQHTAALGASEQEKSLQKEKSAFEGNEQVHLPPASSVPTSIGPSSTAVIAHRTSQDLQRYIELSMFELQGSQEGKRVTDDAWLQSLSSIEEGEKNAIKAFLDSSIDQAWQEGEIEGVPQQSPLYASTCIEAAWPTTPYTPVNLHSRLPHQADTFEREAQPGLSVGEMEEIEEAMYRDYLSQANQYPKASRKKERFGGDWVQGRPRAYSSSRMVHGSPVSSSAGRASTVDELKRPMSGASPLDVLIHPILASAKPDDWRISRGEGIAKDSKSPCALSRQGSTDCGRYGTHRHLKGSRAIGSSSTDLLSDQLSEFPKLAEQQIPDEPKQLTCNGDYANRAVQSSLANLQQHLALVASQKQSRSPRASPMHMNNAYRGVMSASDAMSATIPSALRSPNDRMRRPTSSINACKSPIFASPTRCNQQRLLQDGMQRQQIQLLMEASIEARKLEERHLQSYAQAIGISRQQEDPSTSQTQLQSANEVDRIQLAIAECARLGRMNSTAKQTPLITLTEPSIQERRLRGNLIMNTRSGSLPWSDDPFSLRDQLYTSGPHDMGREEADIFGSYLKRGSGIMNESLLNPSRRHSLQPLHGSNHPTSALQLSPTNANVNAYFPSLDIQRSPQKMERKPNYSAAVRQKVKSGSKSPWQ